MEAPHAFHIEYGLCITFILALSEGQNLLVKTLYYSKFGKHRFLQPWKMLFCYRFSRPEVTKLRPAGQIRPAKPFHPARVDILPMRKNNITKENLLIWQKNFLKQSHFVRCPALGLLSNSICCPRTVD